MRQVNWPILLNSVIVEWSNIDFVWGSSDCFQFAGACIEAVCGINPANEFKNKYNSARSSYKVQKKYGGMEKYFDNLFDRSYNNLSRGDICIHVADDNTIAVAVFYNGNWWGMTQEGCRRIKVEPKVIWSVQ